MRKRCLMVGILVLALAACDTKRSVSTPGAKTPEEAIEMLATAIETHDAKMMVAVMDNSTETDRVAIELAPTLMASQVALEQFDLALSKKFGTDKKDACRIHLPKPSKEAAQILRDAAKGRKGKWETSRVELESNDPGSPPAIFEKNASGLWHVRFPETAMPMSKDELEILKASLNIPEKFSANMLGNLEKYKTPGECADACDKEFKKVTDEVFAEIMKTAAEKETANLAVPQLYSANVHPLPKDISANCLVIKVSAKGVPSLEGKELTPAQLTAAIKDAIKKDPTKKLEIQLRGDLDTTYETVRPVMDAISEAGTEKINLVGYKE